ncbi:MAG: DUF1998 domain-containing protein [Candidatus Latescibacteria bacterium]|nr:DUF1998 domain-containing protein [Candidatus Latescibacterota bacterium]
MVVLGHPGALPVFLFELERGLEAIHVEAGDGVEAVLEVPSTDLNTTVAHGESTPIPPIVLYDNVPGGAGLVARLQEGQVLKNCLETAYHRVAHCTGCGEDSSCYSCLRNYRNQFSHQFLQRGPVVQYLQQLLA